MDYQEITIERAKELGKMIASFSDSETHPVSFNSNVFYAYCFNYKCSLLIKDNGGCWYKEEIKE